ncbi:MAG: sulfotransferase [Candidatus Woesearchaeota archaeon]
MKWRNYFKYKYFLILRAIIKRWGDNGFNYLKYYHSRKVFCVGLNKTATKSLYSAMEDLGFKVGDQRVAEKLFDYWIRRDFKRFIRYCRKAEFFQDVPFSLPYTFIVMDQAFPGSKFILTVRDDEEQWYHSLTRFHEKLWGGQWTNTNIQ